MLDGSAGDKTEDRDLESLLREKERLDSIIKRKYVRDITVMFTDLSGSTQMAEQIGDIAMQALLNRHYDLVRQAIVSNNGFLIKTMGDGTLSYFDDPVDAARSAVALQIANNDWEKTSSHRLRVRCGLNTGSGIVDKSDIAGDVVNLAQRLESIARPLEILISKETYERIKTEKDLRVAFHKTVALKGKLGDREVYRVIWSQAPQEDEEPTEDILRQIGARVEIEGRSEREKKADSEPANARARLTVTRQNAEPTIHYLTDQPVIIGRSSRSDIRISDLFISRQHARISARGNAFFIEDLGSRGGMKFNDEPISLKELSDDDEIFIGPVALKFNLLAEEGARHEKVVDDDEPTVAIEMGDAMALLIKEGGKIVSTTRLAIETPIIIGRRSSCDIRLESPLVSREHAELALKKGGKAILKDLKSNNGILIQGERITDAREISHGEKFMIGPFTLELVDPSKALIDQKIDRGFARKLFDLFSKKEG